MVASSCDAERAFAVLAELQLHIDPLRAHLRPGRTQAFALLCRGVRRAQRVPDRLGGGSCGRAQQAGAGRRCIQPLAGSPMKRHPNGAVLDQKAGKVSGFGAFGRGRDACLRARGLGHGQHKSFGTCGPTRIVPKHAVLVYRHRARNVPSCRRTHSAQDVHVGCTSSPVWARGGYALRLCTTGSNDRWLVQPFFMFIERRTRCLIRSRSRS